MERENRSVAGRYENPAGSVCNEKCSMACLIRIVKCDNPKQTDRIATRRCSGVSEWTCWAVVSTGNPLVCGSDCWQGVMAQADTKSIAAAMVGAGAYDESSLPLPPCLH